MVFFQIYGGQMRAKLLNGWVLLNKFKCNSFKDFCQSDLIFFHKQPNTMPLHAVSSSSVCLFWQCGLYYVVPSFTFTIKMFIGPLHCQEFVFCYKWVKAENVKTFDLIPVRIKVLIDSKHMAAFHLLVVPVSFKARLANSFSESWNELENWRSCHIYTRRGRWATFSFTT